MRILSVGSALDASAAIGVHFYTSQALRRSDAALFSKRRQKPGTVFRQK